MFHSFFKCLAAETSREELLVPHFVAPLISNSMEKSRLLEKSLYVQNAYQIELSKIYLNLYFIYQIEMNHKENFYVI